MIVTSHKAKRVEALDTRCKMWWNIDFVFDNINRDLANYAFETYLGLLNSFMVFHQGKYTMVCQVFNLHLDGSHNTLFNPDPN